MQDELDNGERRCFGSTYVAKRKRDGITVTDHRDGSSFTLTEDDITDLAKFAGLTEHPTSDECNYHTGGDATEGDGPEYDVRIRPTVIGSLIIATAGALSAAAAAHFFEPGDSGGTLLMLGLFGAAGLFLGVVNTVNQVRDGGIAEVVEK